MRGQHRHDVWPIYAFKSSPALEGSHSLHLGNAPIKKRRTLDQKAHLTVEKWPISSLLNSKAVTTGNTHTLDVRNNTRAAADSQRSSRSSPFSGGSPLVSRCEGVSGSEDFLSFFQNQWPTPCRTRTRSPTQLRDVTRFVCRCYHKFPPHLFCLFLSPSTVPPPPHFVLYGHMTLPVRSVERGERVSHEGEKERKEGVRIARIGERAL